MDSQREFLRHAVATVAYRGAKALRDAPEGFGSFKAGPATRTPLEILAHMGDLYDWASSLVTGQKAWRSATPSPWADETARFFSTLAAFDGHLASDLPLAAPAENVLQAAVADSLTHIGQLTMLRGLAGAPIRGENYFMADIVPGRVGPWQSPPRGEF